MVNITLSVSEELHCRMRKHPQFKWSRIASDAIEKQINQAEFLDELLKDSKLTEEDAEEIGHKIKADMYRRFQRKYGSKKL
jgi:hypothetical protein